MRLQVRLIVFDVDGTLVDSQRGIVEAQRRAFAAHGLAPPSRERMLSVVGLSLREAFAALVGAAGPIDGLAEAYKDAWTILRADPAYADALYPGAAALIGDLAGRGDVRLGLATGKSRRGVDRLLAEQGWRDVFATAQTADDHPSKPDPAMLRAALAEAGCVAADAVMVGDTAFDMAMAVAAGVGPLGVAWGYHPSEDLLAAGAASVSADMAALGGELHAFLASPPAPGGRPSDADPALSSCAVAPNDDLGPDAASAEARA